MNKLIVPIAVVMFSASMASTFAAGPVTHPCAIPGPCECDPADPHSCKPGHNGQGLENSCLNSGAGNGGEFALKGGACGAVDTEGSGKVGLDQDPGNSGAQNNAPAS